MAEVIGHEYVVIKECMENRKSIGSILSHSAGRNARFNWLLLLLPIELPQNPETILYTVKIEFFPLRFNQLRTSIKKNEEWLTG
jgi:hypothetical protein